MGVLIFGPCDLLDGLLLSVACVLALVERDSVDDASEGKTEGGGLVDADDRQFSTSSTRFESAFLLRRLPEGALIVEGGKRTRGGPSSGEEDEWDPPSPPLPSDR